MDPPPQLKPRKKISLFSLIAGILLTAICLLPVSDFLVILAKLILAPGIGAQQKAQAEEELSVIGFGLGKAVANHAYYSSLVTGTHPALRERDTTSKSFSLHEVFPSDPTWMPLPSVYGSYEHRYWLGNRDGDWQYRIGIVINQKGKIVTYDTSLVPGGTGGF